MASALCPHGWPWFEECPRCFEETCVDGPTGLVLQAHGEIILGEATSPSFRLTYGVGQRGERVLVGAVNSDVARVQKFTGKKAVKL